MKFKTRGHLTVADCLDQISRRDNFSRRRPQHEKSVNDTFGMQYSDRLAQRPWAHRNTEEQNSHQRKPGNACHSLCLLRLFNPNPFQCFPSDYDVDLIPVVALRHVCGMSIDT